MDKQKRKILLRVLSAATKMAKGRVRVTRELVNGEKIVTYEFAAPSLRNRRGRR